MTHANQIIESTDVPARFGRAMLRRFGWFYWIIGLGRLRKVQIEDHSVEEIRQAHSKGPVVYIFHHRSTVDYLALNTVLNRRRLPLAEWSNGRSTFWWQPVAAAWEALIYRVRRLFSEGIKTDPIDSGWLEQRVADGGTVTLFLNAPTPIHERLFRRSKSDPLEALLRAQELSERPIQLVPMLVVWDRAPSVKQTQVRQFLLANRGAPRWFGQLRQAWVLSPRAFAQAGAAVDLREVVQRIDDPARRARALRTLLRRYLKRESQVVRGPRLIEPREMKRLVLNNPPMRELARTEAEALGKSELAVINEMEKAYDSIAARFRFGVVNLLFLILRPMWTRVFSGVDIGDEDLLRIRQAMREGGTVLIPCHKSHFDYVILSWFFFQNNLIVPHIVAGVNLAIWPLSHVLRSAGAFFIKRSFRGERIYSAVFARYLRELIRQQYPVEFFIEGGRTRTGKLLPPKLGVLSMVFDAASLRPSSSEVTLLPIAIAYEQVAEEGAYARELSGEKKEKETMGQFLKARKVLGRRYGRVYLRVGAPIRCSELVDKTETSPTWSNRSKANQHALLEETGQRIIHHIGQATLVLPTSLVALGLLAHHRRGIRQDELKARLKRFHGFLQHADARSSSSLASFDQAVTQALDRFHRHGLIQPHEDDGNRIWAIETHKRITLDFYKNQVLHFFTLAGYATCAIRGIGTESFRLKDIRPAFVYLLWTLRSEFQLSPDQSATELLQAGLDQLTSYGALQEEKGLYAVVEPAYMGEIYGLFRSIVESYHIVLSQGSQLLPAALSTRDLARAIQSKQEALLAQAAVSRPESMSLIALNNAAKSFLDEGVYTIEDGILSEVEQRREASISRLRPMVS
jgi:glycerol-3-phosphate O-acyltransferase